MTEDATHRIRPVALTTPSRGEEGVERILAAFRAREGFAEPLVYRDEPCRGAAAATRDAIAAAAAASPGAHVLLLEDDILVDPCAPAAVLATRFPPGVAVISFCDMRELPEFAPRGLHVRSPLASDGRGWWGNQALLLHRDAVAMCCREDWFGEDIEATPGVLAHKAIYGDAGRNCSDIRLAMLVHLRGGPRRQYAVHVPSLFKHTGDDSVCFPGRGMGERETRNWIGDRRRFGVDDVLVEERGGSECGRSGSAGDRA
jgi:hypothetical protein